MTWSEPASDGGAAISDYEYVISYLERQREGHVTSGGMDFTETITGLTPGESYTIEVRAKNSVGYSVTSAAYAFSVPAIIPGFAPAAGSLYTAMAGDTHVGEVRNSSLYGACLYVNGKQVNGCQGTKL